MTTEPAPRPAVWLACTLALLAACGLGPVADSTPTQPPAAPPTPIPPTLTAAPTPEPTPPPLGAGFRYSTYGVPLDQSPEYWVRVGREMAANFPGAVPQTIWIVGNVGVKGTVLTFPGFTEDRTIHFNSKDRNEEALTLFDAAGFNVWLQVEPGYAPMETVIDLVLKQYSHHPSVVGFGVDVEWYQSTADAGGEPITDEVAAEWLRAVRKHNPNYRLFLKHWEWDMMPPNAREGILFVDDSQGFDSLDAMVAEFTEWSLALAPAPVGFQFGYNSDHKWWREFENPPAAIGQAILDAVPRTESLFWVDFTIMQVFRP